MATFRVYRMRPHARQSFRWAPHVTGLATVKQRDYEPGDQFEAPDEYALWAELKGSEQAIEVGDLVEVCSATGSALKICKFVGFEAAQWAVVASDAVPGETGTPAVTSISNSGSAQVVQSN